MQTVGVTVYYFVFLQVNKVHFPQKLKKLWARSDEKLADHPLNETIKHY